MKQIEKKVKYVIFGKEYTPDEQKKKARAFAYNLACVALNDVGAGADKNLSQIREILYGIQEICMSETGYEINVNDSELCGSDYRGWKKNPYKNQAKEDK